VFLVLQDMVSEETVLIYHTAAFPKTLNKTAGDILAVGHEGRHAYFHQLIAAARQVSMVVCTRIQHKNSS